MRCAAISQVSGQLLLFCYGMEWSKAFALGVAGAFVVYYALYRDTRFRDFVEAPVRNWKILAIDLVLYLSCAGLVTALFVEPCSTRGAFFAGCGWQGLIGGTASGVDLETLRRSL